ncbi:MAG: transketolase [Patescibacteria group bacterium]|nr:MAG: transketolase [Patescibacteria group bacterium]
MSQNYLDNICKTVRYWILKSTTTAGSGHPTSCLSCTDFVTVLYAKYFRFSLANPDNIYNDRLIFSKGHCSPLLYTLWALSGAFDRKELLSLRKQTSVLEGHPTFRFKLAESATGSLGQGLSIGLGMALALKKLDKQNSAQIYVVLGDSELAEGQNWEAFAWAGYNKITNLVALIDFNRLGQRGETIWGWNSNALKTQIESFGWKVLVVSDGHNNRLIDETYQKNLLIKRDQPLAIIFKTIKGKGVSFLENKENWHGKALNQDQFQQAIKELQPIDKQLKIYLKKPDKIKKANFSNNTHTACFYFDKKQKLASTRSVYGKTLNFLSEFYDNILALDAEVSNSTYAQDFAKSRPDKFFEMFIAEQNMVSTAVGLQRFGFKPFVSSFSAFLTRAFDQIRMAQYSKANIVFIGSHAGTAIGEDGPSQMGLEDIAMFKSILHSTILYPSDSVSAVNLISKAYKLKGIVYIRLTRNETPVIYQPNEEFEIPGFKLHGNHSAETLLITAGATLNEALKAQQILKQQNIETAVIDLYTIKPLPNELNQYLNKAKLTIVIEDHYKYGGIYSTIQEKFPSEKIKQLAVDKLPHSAKPEENLKRHNLLSTKIIEKVKEQLILSSLRDKER